MNGHMFANDGVIADIQSGRAIILEVQNLRRRTDHRAWIDLDILAQRGSPKHSRSLMDPAIVAQRDKRADIGERTDGDILTKLGAIFDDCGGMDIGHDLRLPPDVCL